MSGTARFQEINGRAKIAIVPSRWKPALNSQSDRWQSPATALVCRRAHPGAGPGISVREVQLKLRWADEESLTIGRAGPGELSRLRKKNRQGSWERGSVCKRN